MDVELVVALLLLDDEEETISRLTFERELWVRPLLMNRENYGAFYTTFQEALEDPKECRGYIRMDSRQSDYLVEHLAIMLQKKNTNMHHQYTRITHQN